MKKRTHYFYLSLLISLLIITSCSRDEESPVINYAGPTVIKDGDGNVYNSITIGEQTWLDKNLKTTSFNDGEPIAEVTDDTEWKETQSPAYCWYDNNEAEYKDVTGSLYNYFVVESGKICPVGWHVPSQEEWKTLLDYLGDDAANQLKDANSNLWKVKGNATNSTGFSGLPGGQRSNEGEFRDFRERGIWWISGKEILGLSEFIYYMEMIHSPCDGNKIREGAAGYEYLNNTGFSIRCIKN